MAAWFCLSSFNWVAGWTIFWDERHIMATTDLLSQTVLQVCCISQLCSGLTGSQGSKQPCNYCIQFQTSVCYHPNRAGPSVSLCYRKGSVLSVCNRLFRRTNSGTHPTFTQIHAREMSCRLLTMSTTGRQFGSLWTLAIFFLSGVNSQQVCKCGIWLTPAGLHSMPTTPKCKEHFCTLHLTSCQVGRNYLWSSALHPDFVTEEKCQLSSFFPLVLPSSSEEDELCASAETKDHKWLSMGSCTLSSSFKKPGINGSHQENSCCQGQEQSLSLSLQFAPCTPARV